MDQQSFQVMTGLSEGRSGVYRFLAGLFLKEVTPEMLAILSESDTADALSSLGVNINRIIPDMPQDRLLDGLAQEYAALFIVSGGIPPYESVRVKGLLCQEPAFKVEEFYKRCGLVMTENSIFPDHLGLELLFMGYLAGREAEALERDDKAMAGKWMDQERSFFESHLGHWAFDFLNDMERMAFHPFYQALARLASGFLHSEREYLNVPSDKFKAP